MNNQMNHVNNVVSKIEETGADELGKIFKEADSCLVGDSVYVVWEHDRCKSQEKFFRD